MKTFYTTISLSVLLLFGIRSNAQDANTTLSNLVSPTKINVNLLPKKDNEQNLGSANKGWKNLYLDSALFIDSIRFIGTKAGTGINNTAVGLATLNANTTGKNNTAIGFNSLMFNTTGFSNTAIGSQAMNNATASYNTGIGTYALSNSQGNNNTAIGYSSMIYNSTGFNNTAEGQDAMHSNTEGDDNTATGNEALSSNTTGVKNVATGSFALTANINGAVNTATGSDALYTNTSGSSNTAMGSDALYSNATGSDNTGIGFYSLYFSTASQNTSLGSYALYHATTGGNNTALGYQAGSNVKTGSGNIFIGYNTNCGTTGAITNSTAIGNAVSITNSNTFIFGNTDVTGWGFGVDPGSRVFKVGTTSANGNGAYLTQGGVWTNTSARSKKEDFQQQDKNIILKKIDQLQITKWKYKGTTNEYHYGPMGDDFHRLFNVDDDSSISDMDKTGVLFLGMQQLIKIDEEKDAKINDLQKQIDELKAMIVSKQSIVNSQQFIVASSSSLSQNIPNPFSNSTTINYSLQQKYSSSKIIITDKNGNTLRQINLSKSKGNVSVDAAALSSGAYQYSLYVDGRLIDTKQMVLSK